MVAVTSRGDTLTIGQLIGCRVRDAEGTRLGVVVDLGLTALPELEIVTLLLGAAGLLQRLQVDGPIPRHWAQRRGWRSIPWSAVAKVQPGIIQLGPGWKEERGATALEWRRYEDRLAPR
jgi:hypothetical protein